MKTISCNVFAFFNCNMSVISSKKILVWCIQICYYKKYLKIKTFSQTENYFDLQLKSCKSQQSTVKLK